MEQPRHADPIAAECEPFRVAFRVATDAFVMADQNGRIVEVNPRAEKTFGYSGNELLGQPVEVLVAECLPASAEGPWGTLIRGSDRIHEPRRLTGRRKDGSEVPVEVSCHSSQTSEGLVHVCAFHDVSEREQTAQSTSYLAAIVESSEDAIVGSNLAGEIMSWNRAAETLSGYAAHEVIGKSVSILLPPDVPGELIQKILDSVKDSKRIERTRAKMRRKDGSLVDVSIIVSAVKDRGGHLLGVSAIYRDITVVVQTEAELRIAQQKAEAASRAKSEFLANMSHEIRTPMNVVLGMSGLLLETPLSEEQEDYARSILRGAESLMVVINDILDFSKIEAGKLDIDAADFSMENLIGEITELMSEQTSLKGLELNAEIDPATPAAVHGDAARLRQVLVNLIGNAVKFTERGEIHLRISTTETQAGPQIRFEVCDTGIGIAPEAQGRIFGAFTQADGSTTRKYGGTGLGLTISKRLVELMGGEIGLRSALGEGSTFWFTIPLVPGANPLPEARTDLDRLAGLKVLAVDDNETNRRIVKEQLRSLKIECALAENAIETVTLVREAAARGEPFDVVILDYGMPGMNGIDVARIIRADTALISTRLILMTSYAEKKCKDTALDVNIDVLLHKPVRTSELAKALSKAIGYLAPRAPLDRLTVQPAGTGPRILLVEDHLDNRRLALNLLGKNGYQCDVAVNGEEAVNSVLAKEYSVVLMDCQMPGMDGFQATAAIRVGERDGRRTPIIAMTANAMKGYREKCLAAGMDDYVPKPLRIGHLVAAIERWAPRQVAAVTENEPIRVWSPIA